MESEIQTGLGQQDLTLSSGIGSGVGDQIQTLFKGSTGQSHFKH